MRHEKISLEVEGCVQCSFTTYLLDNFEEIVPDRVRPLIIVCPGGAYEYCSEREAEAVAIKLMGRGFHAAVLRYDTCRNKVEFPQALKEAAWAVAYIREHAEEYHVKADQIYVMGFSAGGHLAASLGVFWHEKWLSDMLGKTSLAIQPNGIILGYPVITAGEYAHVGSVKNLLGSKRSDEMMEQISLEKHVTDKNPPVFIWHTFEDASVPVENSLLFVNALRKANVMTEFHMFPRGGHGLSLASKETARPDASHPEGKEIQKECQQWMELCCNWIQSFQ